jgi:hypothetical protein
MVLLKRKDPSDPHFRMTLSSPHPSEEPQFEAKDPFQDELGLGVEALRKGSKPKTPSFS